MVHLQLQLFVLILLSLIPSFSLAKKPLILNANKVKDVALSKNVSIQIASVDQEIGEQDLPAAKSIYDTTLTARASYLNDKNRRVSTVFGTTTTTTVYDVGIFQKTPLGTEVSASFLNQRDSSNSVFSTVNPAYESAVEFTLRQPVAKNFFGFADRNQIQLVKKQIEALDHYTKSKIESAVYQSLVDYWTYYFHYHNVIFERETVLQARELYLSNKMKKDIGLIEESDLYAFAANSNIRENSWLRAQDTLTNAKELLRQDLGIPPSAALRPGKENISARKTNLTFQDILMTALAHRPDYLALKADLEATHLDVAIKKNSRWPQIDLVASLNLNGIDLDPVNPSYGDSIKDIGNGNPAWKVGMEFSFPIQNRYQRSEYKKSAFQKGRKIFEIKDKEQEIVRQAKQTLTKIKTARARLRVTSQAKSNEFQKLKGERVKYEQGRSDSDTLIRFQNDFISAKQLHLQAQYDYQIALIDLAFIQGSILDY